MPLPIASYNPNRTYDPDLDVRDWSQIAERLGEAPNGVLRVLVGMRRGGKTWALDALCHCLGEERCERIDLRVDRPGDGGRNGVTAVLDRLANEDADYVLLDEPTGVGRSLGDLLAVCAELNQDQTRVLLAATPAEVAMLRTVDRAALQVSPKDFVYLAPLTAAQARRVARTRKAKSLLAQLPAMWKRNPCLLEMLFEMCEGADVPLDRLLRAAVDRCGAQDLGYTRGLLESLDDEQLALLRRVANGEQLVSTDCTVLEGCGVLVRGTTCHEIGDPILANHLPPPLIIHHVSDVHIGPKAAGKVDVKEKAKPGKRLAEAAGEGPIRDDYLAYLRQLRGTPRAPHLLVVSGDLTEMATPPQLTQAKTWIRDLEACLAAHPGLARDVPRVLLVGGNHDVDWNTALGTPSTRRRHRRFAVKFEGYPQPSLHVAPQKRSLAYVRYADAGVEVALFGSAEFGGEAESDGAHKAFLAAIERLRRSAVKARDPAKAQKLRDSVARIDPGLVHHEDLQRARAHGWSEKVRIAVLHHPVSPLPSTEIARFSGLLNAGAVKDALLEKEFCLVLHGHMHSGWFGCEQWPDRHGGRKLRIAAAPTLGSRETQENMGFNVIEVQREGQTYEIVVRRWVRLGTTWAARETMGPFTPGE